MDKPEQVDRIPREAEEVECVMGICDLRRGAYLEGWFYYGAGDKYYRVRAEPGERWYRRV